MKTQRLYDRGVDLETIRVLVDGEKINLQRDDVLRKFDAGTVVRIPESDYPNSAGAGEILPHFGLPIHGDFPGSIAILPKIIEHGFYRRTGEEKLPLLYLENIWKAEIVECFESISYMNLSARFFENLIGKAKDVPSLKELILSRYRNQLPDRSDDEIIAEGVSVRFMKLINKVSLTEIK